MDATNHASLLAPILERGRRDGDWPGLTLIREDNSRDVVTAGQLAASVVEYARGLAAAGIAADDVVVLAMGHSRDLVLTFLGAMYLGAVPTIFSAYLTDKADLGVYRDRIEALVRATAARALITFAAHEAAAQSFVAETGCLALSVDRIRSGGSGSSAAAANHSPERVAFLQYTSGSGGLQKGIAHTHRRVLRYIAAKAIATPLEADDVVVVWPPLYHDMGLLSGLLSPQVLGIPSVLISPLHWIRDPKVLFHAMRDFGGSVTFMPNFALNLCVNIIRDRDLEGVDMRRWKSLVLGGEPVRPENMRSFAERFAAWGFRPDAFVIGYGMAENVEAISGTPRTGPPKIDWIDADTLQREHRARPVAAEQANAVPVVSCGVPIVGTELTVVGDDGNALPEHHVGHVLIRSDCMLEGYHRRPDLTEQAFRDGWFCTGDLGYMAGGEIYVTGRKKDLIIVGGRNIYPEDVEKIADTVPGLSPGRSVAFGVADELSGSERIVIVCETRGELSEDDKLAVERHLRRAVVQALDVALGSVQLVGKGWVVKTSSGKKARPENRAKYLAEFAAAERTTVGPG